MSFGFVIVAILAIAIAIVGVVIAAYRVGHQVRSAAKSALEGQLVPTKTSERTKITAFHRPTGDFWGTAQYVGEGRSRTTTRSREMTRRQSRSA
jgi:hypothetical protein